MKKEFSIYLDLVRFIAALLVLVHHSNFKLLISDGVPFSGHGPASVIVFFVLSGYVISFITSTKERAPVDYWSSRLSRFYSVAIPVVLLCPFLDLLGEAIAPQFYIGKTTHDWALLRAITSLAFVNEIWTLGIMSFSNVPYWSLCYEMWYYVLFAIITFTRGNARVWLASVAIIFVGPKILLLAPVWILGVVLHRYQPMYRLPPWANWLLFISSWPLYGLYQHYGFMDSPLVLQTVGEKWSHELAFSKHFLADYVLGLIVAANFVGFRGIAHHFSTAMLACENVIRWLAGFTFSLYIFHQPLLQFYAAVFNGDPHGKWFYFEVVIATLLNIVVIGTFTEHKRHHLRSWIRQMLVAVMATKWWRHGVIATLAGKQVGG